MGENIADNGGVKTSYLAYQNYVKHNGRDQFLPGLQNFNAAQMFWITYAQTWCSVSRPEFNHHMILTNPHAPGEFRVLGVIENSPYFHHDFGCTNQKPQHERCEMW